MTDTQLDPLQDPEQYVTVAEFIEPVYAQMAKGALESAGIECFLQGEHINNLQMGVVFPSELQVHQRDEKAAREILDASEAEASAAADAQSGAFEAESGGSEVIADDDDRDDRA